MRIPRVSVLVPLLALLGCEAAVDPVALQESEEFTALADPAAAVGGTWAPACGWPMQIAIHAHLLPDGRVLFWGGGETHHNTKGYLKAYLWNPTTCTSTEALNRWTDVFCSGHAFMPDGRLFVAGGHIANNVGLDEANFFDFRRNRWTKAEDMRAGRWYPTVTTLPNGEMLVLAGSDENGATNQIPEVWQVGGGWRQLTSAVQGLPYYPWTFVAPDGRVFYAGWVRRSRYLNTNGQGSWQLMGTYNHPATRTYGSAVMYDAGKILIVGGGEQPTNTAEIIDLNGAATWQYTSSMAYARHHLNATLLADGTVLVTGGTSSKGNTASGAVRAGEIWNPATGQWTTVASMATNRIYHSTALLLPDARVLSAGGGRPAATGDVDHPDAEVFSPPYLFNTDGTLAARPTITSAPTTVGYGQQFVVKTPEAAGIARVTWIRLSSVTHAFNANQRLNHLTFTKATGELRVTAPGNANLAPPGHYMLFIVNDKGVPSIARIVQVS